MIAAREEMTVTRRPRGRQSPAFKAKRAAAVIRAEKTRIALAQDFDLHPNQIKLWRYKLPKGAARGFRRGAEIRSGSDHRCENTAREDRGVGFGDQSFGRRARSRTPI